jgi:hypothetical protein
MGDGADELYRALGKALARWQYVETGMFLLFHGLSSCPFEESSRQFFGREMWPIGVKLKTLNKICRDHPQPDVREHWKPLHKDLKQHRDTRNALAHFEPGRFNLPPETGRGGIQLGLSPQLLDLTKRKADGRVEALFMEEIVQAADEFLITARALIEFIETHVPQWNNRLSALPPYERQHVDAFTRDVWR